MKQSFNILLPTELAGWLISEKMHRIVDEDSGIILLAPVSTDRARVENALGRMIQEVQG